MLTCPQHGWSEFRLENTSRYSLSYLDDIAFKWLEQAIHGLENLYPFCVKGNLEPDRFLCVVSHWHCHIIIENDDRCPLDKDEIIHEFSDTNMLDFCRYLYEDISKNINEWASFVSYNNENTEVKFQELTNLLEKLRLLIISKEEYFGKDRGFT